MPIYPGRDLRLSLFSTPAEERAVFASGSETATERKIQRPTKKLDVRATLGGEHTHRAFLGDFSDSQH